jgi:hypothetical protein
MHFPICIMNLIIVFFLQDHDFCFSKGRIMNLVIEAKPSCFSEIIYYRIMNVVTKTNPSCFYETVYFGHSLRDQSNCGDHDRHLKHKLCFLPELGTEARGSSTHTTIQVSRGSEDYSL